MKTQRHTVVIGAEEHTYTLRRSRRARNLLLHVTLDGSIEVVVPWHVAYREAQRFIGEETQWLSRALAKNRRRAAAMPRRFLVSGELVPVLGEDRQLQVAIDLSRRRSFCREQEGVVAVFAPRPAEVRRALVGWYRKKARQYFEERSEQFAVQLGVHVRHISVSAATSQWGSCIQEKGRLSLNWRLLLGPRAVADYVIAHEVAHLREKGHSENFWHIVAQLAPDFQEQRRWLRKYGHTLVL
jgi:predicted metal-dependent hydrolase